MPVPQAASPDPGDQHPLHRLHPLLAARRSPRAFDPAAAMSPAELTALLDAARWAPSSFNSQPWRFVVGHRDDNAYKRIFGTLVERNQRWAGRASVLLVAAYLTHSEAGRELRHAQYDLGQAIAHLSVQATALGWYVHQMAGFDAGALHAELNLPEQVRPKVVVAIGRLGDPTSLPEDLREREQAARVREPLSNLVLN